MISESVSKKRGRPQAISDAELALASRTFSQTMTTRGLQNGAYAQRAVNELWETWGDYPHFLPPKKMVDSGEQDLPWTILQGIGRLARDEMRVAAKIVNDEKLTPKEAVKFLKAYRLGDRRVKPFSQLELLDILSRAIDSYCESHHCDTSQVTTTLVSLLEIVSDMDAEGGAK